VSTKSLTIGGRGVGVLNLHRDKNSKAWTGERWVDRSLVTSTRDGQRCYSLIGPSAISDEAKKQNEQPTARQSAGFWPKYVSLLASFNHQSALAPRYPLCKSCPRASEARPHFRTGGHYHIIQQHTLIKGRVELQPQRHRLPLANNPRTNLLATRAEEAVAEKHVNKTMPTDNRVAILQEATAVPVRRTEGSRLSKHQTHHFCRRKESTVWVTNSRNSHGTNALDSILSAGCRYCCKNALIITRYLVVNSTVLIFVNPLRITLSSVYLYCFLYHVVT